MRILDTDIKDCKIIEPDVYLDDRGYFFECINLDKFVDVNSIKQVSESLSTKKGTIRGIHLQIAGSSQTKIVHAVSGSLLGICVDLRKNSITYKKIVTEVIDSKKHNQIVIPNGCGWGFETLEDNTILSYFLDNTFNANLEKGINIDSLDINLPIKDNIIRSNKDMNLPSIDNYKDTIGIIGSTGLLGNYLKNILSKYYQVYTPLHDEVDVTNKASIFNYFDNNKCDIIVNCAAFTNVNDAEVNKEACYNVNVNGTKNIVDYCKNNNIKYVGISTDYVFDGKSNTLYTESNEKNPINYYGKTKAMADDIAAEYKNSLIIRTSWLFGKNHKNFVDTMLNLANKGITPEVVCDQIGSPTYALDLSNAILELINSDATGIYNITNNGYYSWNDYANLIFKIYGFNIKSIGVKTNIYYKNNNININRPLNSKLSMDKLEKDYNIVMPSVEDAIKRYKKE